MIILKLLYTIWFYFVSLVFLVLGVFWYTGARIFGGKRAAYWMLTWNKIWAHGYTFFAGHRYHIEGADQIDRKKSYVFASNHTSNADAFILCYCFRSAFKPLAKKELVKIPLLGYLVKSVCVIVDRSSAESREKSFQNMIDCLDSNYSVLLFPEGTRNKTEEPLQRFYEGAFRLAIESNTPLVPIVVTNARRLMPNKGLLVWPHAIQQFYLPAIDTKDLTIDDLPKLIEDVRKDMLKKIEEYEVKS